MYSHHKTLLRLLCLLVLQTIAAFLPPTVIETSIRVPPLAAFVTRDSGRPFDRNVIGGSDMMDLSYPPPRPTVASPLSELELPRHSTPVPAAVWLWDTELHVGRVAMMLALVLFSVELATGRSVFDHMAALWME
jgi:hypothetical protein